MRRQNDEQLEQQECDPLRPAPEPRHTAGTVPVGSECGLPHRQTPAGRLNARAPRWLDTKRHRFVSNRSYDEPLCRNHLSPPLVDARSPIRPI